MTTFVAALVVPRTVVPEPLCRLADLFERSVGRQENHAAEGEEGERHDAQDGRVDESTAHLRPAEDGRQGEDR